ncbi:LysR substrate-binding domain-containing protein [Moritella sp. Urea-trap-13]|uniref:LysR substrate-binding domain-containing protein n=1 Tax=Moritella sp. Urea-trap-13 TaxID=2058327 RepID=UPI000C3282FD|nr:LysR substrate-binding domain-containing protein [Moritella sp. Urea-trap-13]PKH07410.1 LysR family transcriptional regulator [Moritella sp. Urea-trap-13]
MYKSPITIEALQVLDTIDRRGSFAAAAEQLNKVPSALSYIVQKLEEQLAVTLFVRQGRRSVLTPAGRHLLDEGRKLLGAVSKLTEQTQTISHGWEPKINITFDSLFDMQQLFAPLAQFLSEHPNIEVDLNEEVMNGSWEALIEDRTDLLIAAPEPIPHQQGISVTALGHLTKVFVVPKGHELASSTVPLNRSEIDNYRTVVVHDSAQTAIPWSNNLIEQSRHFYVSSVEHKIQAIIAGIGVGYLPKERIQSQLDSGALVEIGLNEGEHVSGIYLAWKTVNKGKGLKRLREIMQQHLAS